MAKLKEFTTDHHWRQRAKLMSPMFEKAGNGAKGLNYQQCQQFYALVGQELLGEPLDHLLTPDLFERFDFNGDGLLDFMHAFKSFKGTLYEIFHVQGGETIKPMVFASPEQKGYTIIKELARGGQGAAILAKSDKYGEVVLKTYEKSNPNSGSIEEHIAEMEVLKELSSEGNIMHAYDIFQDAQCVYCVNELMSGGDLEALREKAGAANVSLTAEYFRKIFRQCLAGLDHIHQHGLMHCDIKEPNIMIKTKDLTNPQVAIIDFGLAHVCAGPGEAGGTPGYIPPETNSRHIWYPKGDIFSMGVAFFQLLADKTPQEKLQKFGVFQEGFRTIDDVVQFTATRPLPVHLIIQTYPGFVPWVSQMCSKEKKPRPRTRQLLDLDFFADLKDQDAEYAGSEFDADTDDDRGCTSCFFFGGGGARDLEAADEEE
jgi:serine/threonine protein kinase